MGSHTYDRVQHPQYVAFVAILSGFLLMWPTLLTLVMFPILVVMYARLARQEERDVEARFGDEWRAWAARTPRWLPRLNPSLTSADDPRRTA